MNRRNFVAALFAALCWPLAAFGKREAKVLMGQKPTEFDMAIVNSIAKLPYWKTDLYEVDIELFSGVSTCRLKGHFLERVGETKEERWRDMPLVPLPLPKLEADCKRLRTSYLISNAVVFGDNPHFVVRHLDVEIVDQCQVHTSKL